MTRLVQLCADPGVPWGGTKGASVHLAELAAALARRGAEVLTVVTRRTDGANAPPGVEVVVLPGPGRDASVEERLASDADRASWLAEQVQGFGADAVYERFALHTGAGHAASRAAGVPHLVELNAPLPAEAAAFRTLEAPTEAHRFEARVLTGADVVCAVSPPLAAYAACRGARRTLIVPNAVDPARFPHPAAVAANPPTAVFTGTLRPWHGIDTLADAWRLLGREAPHLLGVGDGPGREQLAAVGAEITGTLPHASVAALLANAQIGLAPYPARGPDYFSPLKLFEYLAAGLAVVAADLPGVIDAVADNAAVLVPRGDPAALAAAVAHLTAHPDARVTLGGAGRRLAFARHTWDHRAAMVLALAADSRRREALPA
ncbi:MAG: glycosyltransferase [Acidimicrobiia bacterium]